MGNIDACIKESFRKGVAVGAVAAASVGVVIFFSIFYFMRLML